MLRKVIYLIGILITNKGIFDKYKFLLESQHWSIKELQDLQYKKLKILLKNAYENSKYYRNKYDRENYHPDNFKCLADLEKIPLLTKDELLNNVNDIQVKNNFKKLVYSETSGSTGRSLEFYRDQDWDEWHRASIYRGYSWYEVEPWRKNGYLWGFNLKFKQRIKTRFLDLLQNRFRLFSYKDEEIDKFIKKLKNASFLGGYSSMIYELAKRINNTKMIKPQFHLKMIKGTSEKIFDKYQNEVQLAFGQKVISEYGAAEAGIIAFECPGGNMHINMETIIVEEDNNEIVLTNLVSNSFPIIRYKLGDYIKIDRNIKCKCCMQHYVIKEVMGRVGKVIYGFRDQYPSLTLYYVFKNLAIESGIILDYQAIQREKGILHINIENKLNAIERDLLIKEFKKYFNDDLDLKIIDTISLETRNAKKTDFISEL